MTLLIGTDEAGYGPNLGPLVIGATAWRVGAEPADVEPVVTAACAAVEAAVGGRLWGDSKQIYRGGSGLDLLERGVLTALAVAGAGVPANWPALAAALGIGRHPSLPESPELAAVRLPRHVPAGAVVEIAAAVRERLADQGVELAAIRCRLVPPGEFNGLLDHGHNKSDILTAATLELAAELAAAAPADEPLVVWCDRHGGRRRYAPQVARAFAAPLVQPVEETQLRSGYRLGPRRAIEFTVGGEERLPVAAASMTAKYVRELAMLAFNAFWAGRQPGLAPTAGYPVDAARWRREAAATVEREGVAWDRIWRRV